MVYKNNSDYALQPYSNNVFKCLFKTAVASLGWVLPGVATEGVTPIFSPEKLATFFSHHHLPVLRVSPTFIFF